MALGEAECKQREGNVSRKGAKAAKPEHFFAIFASLARNKSASNVTLRSGKGMTKVDLYTKSILTVIAVSLAILALGPFVRPAAVRAEGERADFYIEPGFTTLKAPDGSAQVRGKMVVDLRTGDIWGFPTIVERPYPSDATKTTPPV